MVTRTGKEKKVTPLQQRKGVLTQKIMQRGKNGTTIGQLGDPIFEGGRKGGNKVRVNSYRTNEKKKKD